MMDDLEPIINIRDSYSTNGTYDACERKFELSRLFHQPDRGVWEDSHAADVGTALHKAYQNYVAFRDETRAFMTLAYHYPHMTGGWDDSRSLETCVGMLELMIEKAEFDEFELAMIRDPKSGEVIPATEVSFCIEFVREDRSQPILANGGRFTFVGSIDIIEVSRFSGRHRTNDIKTHQAKILDRSANYKFNAQQIPYGIVLQHVLGNHITEFDVDYLDCFIDLVNPRVEHYTYTKTQTDIQEWLAKRVTKLKRINQALKSGFFARTENGCMSFNKPCRFMDVCESRDPMSVQALLLMGAEPAPFRPFDSMIDLEIEIPEGVL